jgi:PAS domain S-box-containing protein
MSTPASESPPFARPPAGGGDGRAAVPAASGTSFAMSGDDRRVLDAIGQAVIVTDPAGSVVSWNRAAEALYGWSAGEAVGRNILDLTPSNLSRDQAHEILERLSRGESWDGEFIVRRRDGTPFVARVTDTPLLDGDGNLTGIIGVSQDTGSVDGALRHLGYLAEASRILGASLDYERTLREVVRVLVPGFADVCSVFVVESGTPVRVAEAGVDDGTEASMRELRGAPLPAALSELFDEVMLTGRARLVPDYLAHLSVRHAADDDGYRAAMERIQITSAIIAPMIARGKPIGALTLGVVSRSERRFSAPDTSFAEELARRVALAIDNARLYGKAEAARLAVEQREQTQVEERRIFETLYRIGTSLAKEHEEQELIQLVTDEATSLTGASFGSFFFNVKNADGEAYTLYSLSGAPREAFAGFPMPRATPLFGPTFRGEGVIRSDDVRKDPRYGLWGPQPAGHLPVVSYLAVPVMTRAGEVLGGLFFAHGEEGRFTSEHERLVVGIAGQAAIALENARLYAQLRRSETNARDAFAIAREAERRKDEFLAMLGHELRNPLAPIVTALELLRMRGATSREAQIIERQVTHLTRLVDDLLDVARITRGKIELKRQRIELAQVVARAIEIASPLIEQRSHYLAVDVARSGLPVFGDPTRLAQIVSNLLANAAKYTDMGGHIAVRASRSGDSIRLSVRDDGNGIDAAALARIFEPFVQTPQSADRALGGLGIGLTLVRTLLEMHGGGVEAKSAGVGKGSEFIVHLPVAADVAAADTLPPKSSEALAPEGEHALRVLVVDDNADAAEMLAEVLRALGHTVELAEDGPSALRVAASFHPEVAVLDIGLPVMDGFELAEHLREMDRPPRRLIALTGYGQAEDRARGVKAGFDAHLVKPIDIDVLEKAITATAPESRSPS